MALREFTWCVEGGISIDAEPVISKVQFGDGYTQRSSFGINNVIETSALSVKAKRDVIDAAYNFLIDHKGVTPFLLNLSNGKKAFVTDGAITRTHLGGSAWQLTFNVERFYGA